MIRYWLSYIWWRMTRHTHRWEVYPGALVSGLTIEQCVENWGVSCRGCRTYFDLPMTRQMAEATAEEQGRRPHFPPFYYSMKHPKWLQEKPR